jgi:hypothetical protein
VKQCPLQPAKSTVLMERAPTGAACGDAKHGDSQYECNVCLESCVEPVVTTCGHLYWCVTGQVVAAVLSSPPAAPRAAALPAVAGSDQSL